MYHSMEVMMSDGTNMISNSPILVSSSVRYSRMLTKNSSANIAFLDTETVWLSNDCSTQFCNKYNIDSVLIKITINYTHIDF